MIGEKFGRLTVVSLAEVGGRKKYKCRCECGSECIVRADGLKSGHTQSCGCLKRERQSEANSKEIKPGETFFRYTVIRNTEKKDSSGTYLYTCRCECGNEKEISGTSLRSGKVQSCGCLRKERQIAAVKTHGGYKSRLYQIWDAMIQRCTNPNHPSFGYYGGRGVSVYGEWRESFEAFREWSMANGYSEKAGKWECTLDRQETNGDYAPDNCRWITQKEQMNNTRRCINVTVDGTTKNLTQWAEAIGVHRQTLYKVNRQGADVGAYIKSIIERNDMT